MSDQYKTNDNQTITISDDKLGSGGEGSVHRITEPAKLRNYCAKIIYIHQRTKQRQDKIKYMIDNAPEETVKDNFLICWPVKLLFDNGEFVGYIMPLAVEDSIQLYNFTTPKLRKSILRKWRKFDRTTQTGINNLLRLCVNIAYAVHSIHSYSRYVLVDLKPQNILVSPVGKISIIDLDSIEISENGIVLHQAKVTTPEYMPPEGRKMDIAKDLVPQSWDNFSMAVIFYQLIMGLHPYAATARGEYAEVSTIADKIQNGLFPFGSKSKSISNLPEYHQYFIKLPQELKDTFYKSFEDGYHNPEIRSAPNEWGKTIFSLLENEHIIKPFKANRKKTKQVINKSSEEDKIYSISKFPAKIFPRVNAFINDFMLFVTVGTLLTYFINSIFVAIFSIIYIDVRGDLFLGLELIMYLIYFAGLESKFLQTMGKSSKKIGVVNKNGQKISFKQALLRNIIKLLLLPICFITMIADKNGRGLHDIISGSYVIKMEKTK